MKRTGDLFKEILELDNLLAAFHAAAKGKADRGEVIEFRSRLHERLCDIRERLANGTFEFGDYREFEIRDPKQRTIQAAPFEQRVVHHAMVRIAGPMLERSLIYHCYACRKGKGQHAAALAAQSFSRKAPFYLKMDIDKFYDSIPHQRLMQILERRFREKQLLALFERLLASYDKKSGRGLPIGNLTSQYLGNLYLDPFDHWITEEQGLGNYVRYMDDMVVWGTRERLKKVKRDAGVFLGDDLRLAVKHDGELNRCSQGVPFVGWVVYPDKLRLGGGAKKRFSRRIRRIEKAYRSGLIDEHELHERGTALYAAVEQGDTTGLRAAVAHRGMVLPGYA